MMRLVPRSLTGQLGLLILAAFLSAQIISFWLFTGEQGQVLRGALHVEIADRSAAVARAIENAPEASREAILAAARSRHADFTLSREPLVVTEGLGLSDIRARVEGELEAPQVVRVAEIVISPRDDRPVLPPAPMAWLRDRLMAAGIAPSELRLSIRLDDGGWLNVRARNDRPDLQLPPAVLGTMFLSLALILGALWLGLRRITGPLRRLALAAEEFAIDGPAPAMPKRGPEEVRALSAALTRMQARVTGLVADRTRMLAALGHDLRSPITALRLRAEMVDDDETRERMVATLDEMQEMVEATLAYARGVSVDQPMEATDLAELLADLVNEQSAGHPKITLGAVVPVTLPLRRTPMRRALRNLIENAQRYGGGGEVSLRRAGSGAEIVIDDHGPGIPETEIEHVFDPFTRLEASRSRETGGIGLGLSIARAILRAHGGDVGLANRPGGGLRATITLPATGAASGKGTCNIA